MNARNGDNIIIKKLFFRITGKKAYSTPKKENSQKTENYRNG